MPLYRHTQFGKVTLAAVVPGLVVALVLMPLAHAPAPIAIVLALIALMAAAFAWLTVEVNTEVVQVRFALSFVKRTIPIDQIVRVRRVSNPWYYGWGIHRIPGGWLWNVSGFEAVELELTQGRLLRIGTDEPESLARAIAQVAPHVEAHADGDSPAARRPTWKGMLIALFVVIGVGGAIAALFSRQMRDPVVTLSVDTLTIETPFYGDRYALADVTSVALEPCLPRILLRTNGFSAAGILRGWFDVSGLGRTKLFVDAGAPPFIRIETRSGAVWLNFTDSARTRQVYEQLERSRPAP